MVQWGSGGKIVRKIQQNTKIIIKITIVYFRKFFTKKFL